MNEKLKEAAQSEFDARYPVEWNNYTVARNWAMEAWHNALASAARGEIPGFRLLDEGAAKDAKRYRWIKPRLLSADFAYGSPPCYVLTFKMPDNFLASVDLDGDIDAAMLTASREEQK